MQVLASPCKLLFANLHQLASSFDRDLRRIDCFFKNSVTKERTEIILQGTSNKTFYGSDVIWEEYEFKCKPGNVSRRPCLISPYHYRLDWLMWFAAFQVRMFD